MSEHAKGRHPNEAPYIGVKIWVSDDSFESTFSIPVACTPQQIDSFTKSWLGTLAEVIKMPTRTDADGG
jgi:hypothetical protein